MAFSHNRRSEPGLSSRSSRCRGEPSPRAPRARRLPAGRAVIALGLLLLSCGAPAFAQTKAPAPPASAPARPVAAPAPAGPPSSLGDLEGWLEYKTRNHLTSLPIEARLFYRRGILEHASGMVGEGERWVRAAAELDPTFVAPHISLATWSLLKEPSQALLQYATVIELARQTFLLQLALAANALYLGFQSLLLALLAAGFILVVLHLPELCHPWREKLGRLSRPETARWWSLAIVIAPFLAGFGPVLPTLGFLGLLWPSLRGRERAAFLLLLAAVVSLPLTMLVLDRLATPLDADRAPLYGVPLLEGEPWSAEQQARLAALAGEHPDNAFVQFGLAWSARRGGDLAAAEAAYRHALESWPNDDRVLNNLGNTLAMEGRPTEALELYRRAVSDNPANAAAYFNSSQIYTQRYEFRSATEALSRASALDFDLVRSYQSQGSEDGMLPLVDQWISPRSFWIALSRLPGVSERPESLPPAWRARIEASGWGFSLAAVVVALLGLGAGLWENRRTPLRACSNCGRVVCRRCAERRREVALCPGCAALENRSKNSDFTSVLLVQHARRARHRQHLIRTALATIVPGFGLLAFRRVFMPILLLMASMLLASQWAVTSLPFEYEPRLAISGQLVPLPVVLGLWGMVYLWSITGYFARAARARAQAAAQAAPTRSRAVQATRHAPAEAA